MSSGKFKTAITKRREYLTEMIDVGVLLWAKLLDNGILIQEQVDGLENKQFYKTRGEQVNGLLNFLLKAEDKHFEPFCSILTELNQPHVARSLRQAAASTENSGDNNIASSQRSPFSGPAVAASSTAENRQNATDARTDRGLFGKLPTTATSTSGAGDNPFRYAISGGNNYFVVINNYKFNEMTTNLKDMPLEAARKDDENLRAFLNGLNFRIAWYENKTRDEMSKALCEVRDCLDGPVDCFGVAVLSHGDDNSRLYGSDGHWITDKDVVDKFKDCPSLVGKPKIFIFNACRGSKADSGHSTAGTSVAGSQRIPLEADYLYVYTAVPGYFSYLDEVLGSVFIHCLLFAFNQIGSREEFNFISLLTRVNCHLAHGFVTKSNDAAIHNKKTVAVFSSTLTKDLFFVKI